MRLKLKFGLAALGGLLILATACGGATSVSTATPNPPEIPKTYSRVAIIPWWPKPSTSVDIAWVGFSDFRWYFLADRTNGAVQVVNMDTLTVDTAITGFTGSRGKSAISGPNGLIVVPDRNELWVGDGDGTLRVIDLKSLSVVANIPLGGSTRVDEVAYDASRHLIAATSPSESPPFMSFVSVIDRKVTGKVRFPNATGGIEQPVWNPTDMNIYEPLTQTAANPGGEVDVINPTSLKVIRVITLTDCNPHGATFGPRQHLLLGCSGEAIKGGAHASSVVIDAPTGKVEAKVTEVGGSDQVWYNPSEDRYYVAAYQMTTDGTRAGNPNPVVGVLDAATNAWITNIPTSAVSHSVAVDPRTNRIFVPVNEGITVFHTGK
jgi:hypothetical protein